MSSIKFFKVNSLPAVLEPNSIYFVNTAGILTVHVSDKDGVSSISLLEGINGNTFPYLVRKESPKVVGDTNGTALTTLGVNTRRMYFIPFISPRDIILTNVRVRVTGSSNGNILLGIYDNTKLANGNDNPFDLVSPTLTANANNNGDKTMPVSMTLLAGKLYWFGIMCSVAPTLQAVPLSSIQGALGRSPTGTTAITHLYKDYPTFAIPTLGPTDLLGGTGNIPAIYLVE